MAEVAGDALLAQRLRGFTDCRVLKESLHAIPCFRDFCPAKAFARLESSETAVISSDASVYKGGKGGRDTVGGWCPALKGGEHERR